MLNFVEIINPIDNAFPSSVRCNGQNIYYFNNEVVKQYNYLDKTLTLKKKFEQSIDEDFCKVLFLNRTLWNSTGDRMVVVNVNKTTDMVFLTEYDSNGNVAGKQTIRKRHCFTDVRDMNNEYVVIHDNQNYLEFYRVNWNKPCSFEKAYKLSVHLDIPFIFLGVAMSETHYFLLAAQKDKLQIFTRDINFKAETKDPINPNPFNVVAIDETKETKAPVPAPLLKQSKRIDNLSSYTLTMEMDLPDSMPIDFLYVSGSLFFNVNDFVFRYTLEDKMLSKFDIPFSVRLIANTDNTVTYLTINELGILHSQGQTKKVYSEAINAWNNWGIQEKNEMIDLECLNPDVFFIVSPVDCFIVDHGEFVEGFEFSPVFVKSFKLE